MLSEVGSLTLKFRGGIFPSKQKKNHVSREGSRGRESDYSHLSKARCQALEKVTEFQGFVDQGCDTGKTGLEEKQVATQGEKLEDRREPQWGFPHSPLWSGGGLGWPEARQ